MEHTLDTFKTQQAHALELLNKLQHFLGQGVAAGVPIDPALNSKLQAAIDSVSGEKLDKDRFRRDLGNVEGAYREVMKRLMGK